MTIIEFIKDNGVAVWGGVGVIVTGISMYIIPKYISKLIARRNESKKKGKAETIIVYKDRYLNQNLIPEKDLEKSKFYYEADGKDFFAKKGNFFLNLLDLKGYLKRRLRKKYPDKVVLIRMEMNNGQYKEYIVAEDEKNGFQRGRNKYIFDLDAKYYVIDSNIWAYDYHESLVMPIKRRIPVNEIKSTMEHSNITEVENAINPVTLERFIKSEIAQGILQGAMIGKLFKVMLIIIIIVLVVSAIDLVIDLMDSGVMSELMNKVK